jgi:hypothetical protein
MHTVLHKDEIQVKESKVVVRDGGGGHWRPVPRLHAPKYPLAAAQSVGKHLHDGKKKGRKHDINNQMDLLHKLKYGIEGS